MPSVTYSTIPLLTRAEIATEQNAIYPIPLTAFRVWDAVSQLLPGDGQVEAAVCHAAYRWEPNAADDTFFTAGRAYRVVGITSRVEVAGTDGGAVTAAIKKAASGTDIASGTALHSSTINLKGTVDTNQTLTLSVTSSDLDIASGTSIGIDFTGTLTSARGTVTVLMTPAGSADDLRIVGGTLGTHAPTITAGDVKTTSGTKYARCQIPLPIEYKAGAAVTIRAKAGVQTTVADTSCTIDFEVRRVARDTTVGSDICATSATTINSTTFAEKEFTITPTTLSPGDLLDVRMALIFVDSATVTAVTPTVAAVELLCDVRG